MNRRGLLKLLGIAPAVGFVASESKTPVKTAIVEEGLTQPLAIPIGSSDCVHPYVLCSTASRKRGGSTSFE